MTALRLKTAVVGGLLLAAATPPAWFAGAEFAVVLGLAAWYAVATAARRPLWGSYLLGCVHMACFSWSVRHVLLPAYLFIVLMGGVYFVVATAAVRRVGPQRRAWAFAVAAAASLWLRAEMPEICYPHGQPCHALWEHPWLLGGVRLGGEPLVNALLAAVGAWLVEGWRAWRVAAMPMRSAVGGCAAAVAAWLVVAWLGSAPPPPPVATVRVGIIEPGLHPFDSYASADARTFRRLFEERYLAPTSDLLRRDDAPELVLWPESSLWERFAEDRLSRRNPRLDFGLPLGDRRLLLGALLARDVRTTPIAVLVGAEGQVHGWHEKRRLVPGGEFLPFVDWLPESAAAAVYQAFRQALGSAPDCAHGRPRAPLQTTSGVPFAALSCYDNAFAEPTGEQVAAGARLVAVLSNEAWYRGGAELTQLVAMTVCRAIECRVPFVRCTMDGWSVAIGADGRLLAAAPLQAAPRATAATLVVDVPVAAASDPGPLALRRAAGPVAAGLLVLLLAMGWCRRRTAPA
ncbi:MAG: hypothetical protein RL398_519 [Planctomycetota bacterium]